MNWQTQICSLLFRRNKIEPPLQKSGWHLILQAVSSEPSLALNCLQMIDNLSSKTIATLLK
jgi:hypothetical protein